MIFVGDAVWNVVGGDFDTRASVGCGELPGHRHGAGQGGVVGDEVNGLNDPDVLGDLDVSSLDDVRIGGGLARRGETASVYVKTSRYEPPGRNSNLSNFALIPSGGNQAVSASRSMRAAYTKSGGTAITRDAVSVRGIR